MKDPRLKRVGVAGYNKPKRTPGHKTKSHVVVAKEGDKVKTIRFGQQGKTGDKTIPVKIIKAIQNNTEAEVTLDDGLKAVAIGQAAELSIKEKRVVKLSELL